MLSCVLYGIKPVDYLSSKTGKQVIGLNVYFGKFVEGVLGTIPLKEKYVSSKNGLYSLFISSDIVIGGTYEIDFNEYGDINIINLKKGI